MTSTAATAAARAERYLSTSTVAQRLQLADRTVRRQCAAGAIPAMRVGDGPWRVPSSWVHAQLARIGAVIRRPPPRNHHE